MNANELADELERPNNWQQENNFTTRAATMLRQQQADLKDADKYALELERLYEDAKAEIEFLKKEILEKHEDWKHEGQQAANARAEIEALKLQLHTTLTNRNLRTYDGKHT